MNKYNVGTILIVTFLAVVATITIPGLNPVWSLCLAAVFGAIQGYAQSYLLPQKRSWLWFTVVYAYVLISTVLILHLFRN